MSTEEKLKEALQALKSIASFHRDNAHLPEFWMELPHEQCADTLAADTLIARTAYEDLTK